MRLDSSKSKLNEYIKLSMTLFAITLVVAALLALVNFFTSAKIAQIDQQKLEEAMSVVMPDGKAFEDITSVVTEKWSNDVALLSVQTAKDDKGEVIGYCVEVSPKGYSDVIDMMVGLNADGEITNTNIISLSDTPGIGTQIKETSFLDQFIGKSGVLTTVKGSASSSNEVALISGATYSSGGFSDGVNAALEAYKIIVEEGL